MSDLKGNHSTSFLKLAALLFTLLFVFKVSAQQKPTLIFLSDSILIGEPTPVSLSYKHLPKQDILFPDSTYNFEPFEYMSREIFNTKTDSLSIDSCIYWLSTFEIDKIQTLKLPVFIYTKKDSIPVFSNIDSIFLKEIIPIVSDTLKVKVNTNLQPIETNFNTLLFTVVSLSLLIFLSFLLFVFRHKIRKYFKIKKLRKSHSTFILNINQAISSYENEKNSYKLEEILTLWKSYMEELSLIPFRKLSTKEIQLHISNEQIIHQLKLADSELYGSVQNNEYDFDTLLEFAISRFNETLDTVEND